MKKKEKKKRGEQLEKESCFSHKNSEVTKKTGRGLRGQAIHRAMAGLKNNFPRGGRSISHKQSSTQGQTCFNYYQSVEKSFLSKCLALLLKQSVLCSYHQFCHYFLLTIDSFIGKKDRGQNLDGRVGYAWLIHRLLPVIAKECRTPHRGGQGTRPTVQEQSHHPRVQVQFALAMYHGIY